MPLVHFCSRALFIFSATNEQTNKFKQFSLDMSVRFFFFNSGNVAVVVFISAEIDNCDLKSVPSIVRASNETKEIHLAIAM